MMPREASLSLRASIVAAVGAEVDDVVKRFVREGVETRGHRKRGAEAAHGVRLGRFGADRGDGRGQAGRTRRLFQPLDTAPGVGHDKHSAAFQRRTPLGAYVRVLDARPRLHKRDGRRAQGVVDGDEESLAGLAVEHYALVDDDVFLERAFEIVAEGGVG